MAEYDLIHRNPKVVLARDGVEDEKAKAARILAMCADKPIRRITCAADIQRPTNWLTPRMKDTRKREQTALEKRAAVLALLKERGPMLKRHIEEALGFVLPCDGKHVHSLANMRADGLVKHHKIREKPGKMARIIHKWEAL